MKIIYQLHSNEQVRVTDLVRKLQELTGTTNGVVGYSSVCENDGYPQEDIGKPLVQVLDSRIHVRRLKLDFPPVVYFEVVYDKQLQQRNSPTLDEADNFKIAGNKITPETIEQVRRELGLTVISSERHTVPQTPLRFMYIPGE